MVLNFYSIGEPVTQLCLQPQIWIGEWSLQIYTQLKRLRKESLEKFMVEQDSNPWPLRYRGSALPIELSSQLWAGHFVNSYYTRRGDEMKVNIWKFIYLNCGRKRSSNIRIFKYSLLTPNLPVYLANAKKSYWLLRDNFTFRSINDRVTRRVFISWTGWGIWTSQSSKFYMTIGFSRGRRGIQP